MRRFLLSILLVALFSIASFGMSIAFAERGHDHHGCPFAPGEMCVMTPSTHASAWQFTFASTLSFFVWCGLTLLPQVWARDYQKKQTVRRLLFEREQGLPPPLFTELFRLGLLHPKVPQGSR